MTRERRYDIDWLRVIAIALLLIYHIAIVFQPWALFIGFIKSDEPLQGMWKGMSMLNVWRIPLLFYISGMGLFFAMKKRNLKQVLSERAKRILLPLLFGIVAIAPLHFYIFQQYYKLPLNYYPHMGHLWFLANIFVYVLLLAPLFHYFFRNGQPVWFKRFLHFISLPLGPLFISVFFALEAILVKPQLFTLYAETWHGFFMGLLAFLFGFLFVWSGDNFWRNIQKWKWMYIELATVLFLIRLQMFQGNAPGYLMAVESNCWIFGLFGLASHLRNKPSSVLSYLSKAAYPVYIVHMFVLYAGAFFILPLKVSPLIQFLLITVFTFAGCYIIYELLIRRVKFIRPLFGLNWNKHLKGEKVVVYSKVLHQKQSKP